jgi:hypothetical protein
MSIKLKNKEKIDIGSVLIAFKDEPAYSIKKGDEFEVVLWYPYYGRTKLELKNIITKERVNIGIDWDCLQLKT